MGRAFAAAAPGAVVHQFIDRKATENAFRTYAPESRWIYLTTHGFFDKDLIRRGIALRARSPARHRATRASRPQYRAS